MADTPKPVDKTALRSLIASEIEAALGNDGSQLQSDRALAMDYYRGRPFGNELEDRSSVVSTDVRDTVEWIMPTLMRMFTSGEDVVQFNPEKPGDEAFAKQVTEYVNFIWNRDNPGFLNFYAWFKDALMQKVGVLKIYYDDSPIPKRERYYGLDDEAFATLVNDDSVTVSEHTESQQTIQVPTPDPQTGQITVQNQPITVHDVVITRETPGGRVCIEGVPPEEFLISREARAMETARMVAHRKRVTISSLREEGVPEEIMRQIAGDADTMPINLEEIARNTVENYTPSANVENTAEALVWRTECYIRADMDGDGISEMRKVTVAGPGYTILSDEPWDGPRPFAALTPIIMPHRFYGLSVADLVMDIQLIRSTILRQYLDNLYLSNNQRLEVVERNIIDPTEVLSSRPGGVVRVKERESVLPIMVPAIGQAALAGLEYIDQIRENRTGVSERTQGLGANDLHDTATGEQMLMSAAMGKIELIARTFAETGVKDAMRLVLRLVCSYQTKPRIIRLTDKWVPMDPRSWNEDMDVTISVGLGTGDSQMRMQQALMLGQAQAQAAMSGRLNITPENAMATAKLLVNAMGLRDESQYFSLPDPNAPQPPNPEIIKAQMQAQSQQAQAELNAQIKQIQMQQEATLESRQMQMEAALKKYQIEMEYILKQSQMAQDAQMQRLKLVSDHTLGRAKIAAQRASIGADVRFGGQPG